MPNLNDLRDYVQHAYVGTIHQKQGIKYDVAADSNFLNELEDNLWYTYNGESFQLLYQNTQAPQYLNDKTLDIMMQWHLSLLLNVTSLIDM